MIVQSREEEVESLRVRLAEAERALRELAASKGPTPVHKTAPPPLLLDAAKYGVRSQQQLLQAVFAETLDALLLADDDGVYVDANPAACELFGLQREQLIGSRLSQFTVSRYDHKAAWHAFLEV